MKKKLKLLAIIPTFLLFTSVASASKCEYSELSQINKEAAGVKVTYEEVNELINDPTSEGGSDLEYEYDMYDTYFKVTISNLTNDLYVKVINSADNSTKEFSGADAKDGIVSFNWKDLNTIANLTIKVYTNSNTSCPDEEVLVNYLTLPMRNEYYTWVGCTNNPDASICKKYVTSEVTYEAYQKLATKQTKKTAEEIKEENEGNSVSRFIKKNKKGFIIGGSIIIVMGVVATVVVIRKRRSRLI